ILGNEHNVVNHAPTIEMQGAETITVYEQALADAQGGASATPGNNEVDSTWVGNFGVVDSDGDSVTLSLVAPTETYTSHGTVIEWATNEDGQLVGSANGAPVMTITLSDINDGEASYTVTLSGPFDHNQEATDDQLSIDFGIAANDGENTTTEMVTVIVADATPNAVTTDASITIGDLSAGSATVHATSASFTSANVDHHGYGYGYGRHYDSGRYDSDGDGDVDTVYWGMALSLLPTVLLKVTRSAMLRWGIASPLAALPITMHRLQQVVTHSKMRY
ncbi:hypothetical protein P4S72_12100, partial [Vibrio sp. PP-XX7]